MIYSIYLSEKEKFVLQILNSTFNLFELLEHDKLAIILFDRIDVNELYSLLCNGLRVIGATQIINIETIIHSIGSEFKELLRLVFLIKGTLFDFLEIVYYLAM